MKRKNFSVLILLLSIILLSGCTDDSSNKNLPDIVIIGVDGSTINLTVDEIKAINAYSGFSSYENSLGNWQGYGVYKGVEISLLAELGGGIHEGDILIATSNDGDSQIYSYSNIYPNTNYSQLQGIMILAYEFNETETPIWEDGLQIAFIPEDGQYSTKDQAETASLEYLNAAASTRWLKNVKKLEFRREEEKIVFRSKENYSLTESQVRQLPSMVGSGGYLKSTGAISGPFTYTGVNITASLELFMNISDEFSIKVISSDGYEFTYTKSQIFGNVPIYNEEGEEIGHGGSNNLSLVLAYEEGGKPLTSAIGGPFRMVYIGLNNSLITDGHFWSKYVEEIVIGEGIDDWTLSLSGLLNAEIGLDDFDSIVYCGDQIHNMTHQYLENGKLITYEGMPLWIALSIVDGGERELHTGHDFYNDFLAFRGYNVRITSEDGSYLILNSSITTRNNALILAHIRNGINLPTDEFPIRLVSPELPESQWLKKIVSIRIENITDFDFAKQIHLTSEINSSLSTNLTMNEFIAIVSCPHHSSAFNITNFDEITITYTGLPLYILIAIIDGADSGTHYKGFNYDFNYDLASTGYIVQVIAENGTYMEFMSQDLINNPSFLLAYLQDGSPLVASESPWIFIGSNLTINQCLSNIVEIKIFNT